MSALFCLTDVSLNVTFVSVGKRLCAVGLVQESPEEGTLACGYLDGPRRKANLCNRRLCALLAFIAGRGHARGRGHAHAGYWTRASGGWGSAHCKLSDGAEVQGGDYTREVLREREIYERFCAWIPRWGSEA